MTFKIISTYKVFDGEGRVITHSSKVCACDMTFAVYLPPQAKQGKVPVLWWLSGLTCTHENGMTKGGLQAHAAKYGMAIIYPDTSPRGEDVPNNDAFDMGQGASFYIDATEAPWVRNFQMYSYITKELPQVLSQIPELDMERQCISGHSMGGHGALMIGMKNPDQFKSISAFAPMASISTSAKWGIPQLTAYLGNAPEKWAEHDASLLAATYDREVLIDQGDADNFWEELQPEKLQDRPNINMRIREGYDHSYYFVTTFSEAHFAWHAKHLA